MNIDVIINSKDIIQKIDKMAKANGMSRDKFLNKSLENLAQSKELSRIDSMFSELIKKNIGILDLNTKVLNTFCEENIIDISRFTFEEE